MIKIVTSDPFYVHGTLKVKVHYCFDCEHWHSIDETCPMLEELN